MLAEAGQTYGLNYFRGKDEVEKYLTGNSEPSDFIYFRLYRSQVPVVEQALEVAARMLGSDHSRGYCLEMICADFLAGANAENGYPNLLLMGMRRLFGLLSAGCKHQQHGSTAASITQ